MKHLVISLNDTEDGKGYFFTSKPIRIRNEAIAKLVLEMLCDDLEKKIEEINEKI
jgi:hypothetical protein